jgi:hypothetical protein
MTAPGAMLSPAETRAVSQVRADPAGLGTPTPRAPHLLQWNTSCPAI